jgi:hypothetical protein
MEENYKDLTSQENSYRERGERNDRQDRVEKRDD